MIVWARRFPLRLFYGLALILATAGLLVVVHTPGLLPTYLAWSRATGIYATVAEPLQFTLATGHWRFLAVSLFAAAPTLAALVVISLRPDGVSWAGFRQRLRLWRTPANVHTAGMVYAVIAVTIAGGAVGLFLLAPDQAVRDSLAQRFGGNIMEVAVRSLIYALTDLGGLSEQPGWQGFLLPLLLRRGHSRLAAALMVGGLWAAWHLPRDLMLAFSPDSPGAFIQKELLFLVKCLCLAVLITLACTMAGGVIWPGVLIHGSVNLWSRIGGETLGGQWNMAYLGFLLLTAAIVASALMKTDRCHMG